MTGSERRHPWLLVLQKYEENWEAVGIVINHLVHHSVRMAVRMPALPGKNGR